MVVCSPGVAPTATILGDARHREIPVVTEVEFAWRHLPDRPMAAVTGSNGKSTVTVLVAAMLSESGVAAVAGGNLGTAACELVLTGGWDRWVLEVSSFQAELLTEMPRCFSSSSQSLLACFAPRRPRLARRQPRARIPGQQGFRRSGRRQDDLSRPDPAPAKPLGLQPGPGRPGPGTPGPGADTLTAVDVTAGSEAIQASGRFDRWLLDRLRQRRGVTALPITLEYGHIYVIPTRFGAWFGRRGIKA